MFHSIKGEPSSEQKIRLLSSHCGPSLNLSSACVLLCELRRWTREKGRGIVRLLFFVFGSRREYPPPFLLRYKTRLTVMVCRLGSKSAHFKAKYSSGRNPDTKASSNISPYLSSERAARNFLAISSVNHCLSICSCFGKVT